MMYLYDLQEKNKGENAGISKQLSILTYTKMKK